MDNFIRMMTQDGAVRAMALDSTELCGQAHRIHDTTPVMTAALGRTLTAASLLGSLLKAETQSLTLQIKGSGPAGTLLAVSDAAGNVRGYPVNPHVQLPLNDKGKLDVSGAVGKEGFVGVIRDMGLKEPYVGQTPIVSGEIAEDITHYLTVSEQAPSAVALGVLVNPDWSVRRAGGFLIQLMPQAVEETVATLEQALDGLPSVTTLLDQGNSPEDILRRILRDLDPVELERGTKEYLCNCSKQRVERALISLGKAQLTELLDEPVMEVGCQFCEQKYHLTPNELRELLQSLS